MKFVIAGNYGANNLGDELILQGLLETLQKIDKKAEITVLSANPQQTTAQYGVKAVKPFPAGLRSIATSLFDKETKQAVKNCDYFILGGGGLFSGLTLHANIIWGIQALQAYKLKKPVIMYGQSIGEISNKSILTLLKKLFQQAHFIALRDKDSIKRLQYIGVENPMHLMPDLAFKLKVPEKSIKPKKLTIALRELPKLTAYFRQSISNFSNWLIEAQKWKIDFVDFKQPNDAKLYQSIQKHIKKHGYIKHIRKHEDILESIQSSKVVLGMRLHSIIMAIKTNTPFLAICYAPKTKAILKDLGLEQYSIDLHETSAQLLQQKLDLVLHNYDKIAQKLKKINEKAKKDHAKVESLLSNSLASN